MPYMTNGKRNYQKEKKWDHENGRLKDRAARNKVRRKAIEEGKASKGDGTHVDHKKPLTEGGSNSKSNTRVVSAKDNLRKEALRKKRASK
jgi:hypothetical protein